MYDRPDSLAIVDRFAEHYKISKKQAATMYQIFIESFYDFLEKGEGRVYIENLGQFKVVKKNGKAAIQFNPSMVLVHIAQDLVDKGFVHTRHKRIPEEKV